MVTLPCPFNNHNISSPSPQTGPRGYVLSWSSLPLWALLPTRLFPQVILFIVFLPEGYSCGILPPISPLVPNRFLVPKSIRPLGTPSISPGNIRLGRSCIFLLPFFSWFRPRFVVWLPLRIPFLLRFLLVLDGLWSFLLSRLLDMVQAERCGIRCEFASEFGVRVEMIESQFFPRHEMVHIIWEPIFCWPFCADILCIEHD